MQVIQLEKHKPKRLGLALGGGAVRGAAHIGVLQVLEREGIHPTIIAGTSAGALVGACYAAGLTAEEIGRLARSVRWPSLARLSWRRSLGLFDTEPLQALLQANLTVQTFEALPRRFAVVACDITSGQRIVLQTGSVARAVRASAAIPGLFAPVEIDGKLLVDGGVVDNLPVDVARELGADYVIGVDLFPPPSGQHRPETLFELLLVAGGLWSRGNHPPPSAIDCYILPDIGDYRVWDFDAVLALQACGRAAAEQVIGQIKADLGLDRVWAPAEPVSI